METNSMRGIARTRALVITAGVSVAALLFVVADEIAKNIGGLEVSAGQGKVSSLLYPNTSSAAVSDATSSDPLSSLGETVAQNLLGAYTNLKQSGAYSTSTAQVVGTTLADSMKTDISSQTFSTADIQTDPDTSYNRMLQYRADLKTSLEPLTESTQPEYELFALYIETGDAGILSKISAVAQNYRRAIAMTSKVVVPKDAVEAHIGILNAMSKFAATLDQLVAHANDPYASVAVLQAYEQGEAAMLTSFNALIAYEKQKQP